MTTNAVPRPDVSLTAASRFVAGSGFVVDVPTDASGGDLVDHEPGPRDEPAGGGE